MKRMMIATALATTIGTAGLAATEAQIREVQNFDQSIDTSGLTDAQYDIAYGIVTSGDSVSEKSAKLLALTTKGEVDQSMAMISEAEMDRLMRYAPEADLGTASQAQVEMALAASYSGDSFSETSLRVQSILDGNDETTRIVVGESVADLLRRYAPEADLTNLTADELAIAMSYINSDMTRTETADRIQTLLN